MLRFYLYTRTYSYADWLERFHSSVPSQFRDYTGSTSSVVPFSSIVAPQRHFSEPSRQVQAKCAADSKTVPGTGTCSKTQGGAGRERTGTCTGTGTRVPVP